MKQTQTTIGIPIVREWVIRRPYVYRYLDKQFVDDFFESGKLRIGSFNQFSLHADEQRLDRSEGWGIVENHNDKGSIFWAVGQGSTAAVLCGSTLFSENLQTAFQTDSGFRIDNTTAFGNVISSHIPGFRIGIEGTCIYRSKRVISRRIKEIDPESFKVDSTKGDDMDLNKMMRAASMVAGNDLFFLKHHSFTNQSEYRLVWIGSAEIKGFIDIQCPEARQFCTPFSKLDDE
jgi:hypothetical protein